MRLLEKLREEVLRQRDECDPPTNFAAGKICAYERVLWYIDFLDEGVD